MAHKVTTPKLGDQLDFELAPVSGGVDQGAVVFDHATGLPMTRAAARAMSTTAIGAAMSKAVTRLDGSATSPASTAGPAGASSPLDSMHVIWLIDKFSQFFEKPLIDLDKVDRKRWSTLDAVADLLAESIASRQ